MFEQEQVASYVSMKLSNNAFNEENYICRVPRDTVSMNGIVSDIVAGTPSIDAYVIMHAAELIKSKILELLQQGRSVDVLELGTMYLKPQGTVTRSNPQVADLPSLGLQFTPSAEARAAIAEVSGISFMINDSSPEIQAVLDLVSMTEGEIRSGEPVRITGAKMKLAIDDDGAYESGNGIYLVPPLESGEPDTDPDNWISVLASGIITNYAKKIEVWMPTGISAGSSYYLYIESTYLSKSERRKTAVGGYSPSAYSVVS